MGVTAYSTVAASNTTISSIPLGENAMAPSDVNNAFQQIMADIANGIVNGDFATTSGLQPLDATLTALAGVSTAANKVIYATGSDTFSTTDLTAYGRTLIGYASAAALKSALGVPVVTASSIANPGYVKLDLDGDGNYDIMIAWGSGSGMSGNSTTTVSYPTPFSTFAIPAVNGGNSNTNNEGNVTPYSAGLSSFSIKNSAGGASASYWWIAVGK